MMHFPNEILSIIINELSPDEKEALAALASCRLACRTLYSIATPLVFSSIRLTEDEPSYTGSYEAAIPIRAAKLREILIHNNNIATVVRTLVLRYHEENNGSSVGGGIIASILRHLPYIEDFTLETLTSYYYFQFSSIPKDLSSAIQALLRSCHLTKLYLSNLSDFPLILIANCTELQNLRLSRIEFSVTFPLFWNFSNDWTLYCRKPWMIHQPFMSPTWTPWRLMKAACIPSANTWKKTHCFEIIFHDSRIFASSTWVDFPHVWYGIMVGILSVSLHKT